MAHSDMPSQHLKFILLSSLLTLQRVKTRRLSRSWSDNNGRPSPSGSISPDPIVASRYVVCKIEKRKQKFCHVTVTCFWAMADEVLLILRHRTRTGQHLKAPQNGDVWETGRVKLQEFLISALDGGMCSASRFGRFTSGESHLGAHYNGCWVGPRANLYVVQTKQISALAGNLKPVVHLDARLPTVWGISFKTCVDTFLKKKSSKYLWIEKCTSCYAWWVF
jgi:hypothetical protein